MTITLRSKTAVLVLSGALSVGLVAAGCAQSGTSPATSRPVSGSGSAGAEYWAGPAVTTTPMSARDAQALDAATSAALSADEDGATGFIIGVWDPVKGFHIAAAGTDSTAGAPMRTDTHMYIGSVTKTATAAAVLQLVDARSLSLDDTVTTVLPDLAAEFPALAPVTVRRLLDMSSGIPDYANVEKGGILPIVWADPAHTFTNHDLIKIALESNPVAPLGTAGYSNTNYIILGEMLAKRTGGTPSAAVNATLSKLGLTQTTLNPDPTSALPSPGSAGYYGAAEGLNAAAHGYNYGATTDVTGWNRSWAGTAGGISSTAEDLAKFAASGFGTTLLSPSLAAERTTGVTLGDFSAAVGLYGLGVGVRGDWLNHEGQLIGWEAFAFYNRRTGAVAAILTNSSGSMPSAQAVLKPYFPEIATYWDPTKAELAAARNTPAPG